MLCLPRNLHLEDHKARSPQNLPFEFLKKLCFSQHLHRAVQFEVFATKSALRGSRNLHLQVHQVLRLPRTLCREVDTKCACLPHVGEHTLGRRTFNRTPSQTRPWTLRSVGAGPSYTGQKKVALLDVETHDNPIPLESYTMRQGKVWAVICHPGKPFIIINLKECDT